jgi:hypothetical protein
MSDKLVYREFDDKYGEKLKIEGFKIVESDGNPILVHRLSKILDSGTKVTFYKATRFFRLTRVGRQEEQNKDLLQEHSDIIRGLYQSGVSYCQVICNILDAGNDQAFGLLFYYGVQSVESTEDAAIRGCRRDYEALLRSFQGTHRTAHIQPPTYEEIHWMFRKLRGEQYVTVVKGIPAPKISSSPQKNVLKTTTSTSEQLEQFLTGLADKEFMLLLMCTPIPQQTLRDWLTASLKEQTKWESMKQGSTSFNASLSVPMTMSLSGGTSKGTSASTGSSLSHSHGTSAGENHSTSDGTSSSSGWNVSDSTSSGKNEGTNAGWNNGTNYGSNDGSSHTGGASAGFSKIVSVSSSHERWRHAQHEQRDFARDERRKLIRDFVVRVVVVRSVRVDRSVALHVGRIFVRDVRLDVRRDVVQLRDFFRPDFGLGAIDGLGPFDRIQQVLPVPGHHGRLHLRASHSAEPTSQEHD